MSVTNITLECDGPGCWAFFHFHMNNPDAVREYAAARNGWTFVDGEDFCLPCGRGDTPQTRGEATDD